MILLIIGLFCIVIGTFIRLGTKSVGSHFWDYDTFYDIISGILFFAGVFLCFLSLIFWFDSMRLSQQPPAPTEQATQIETPTDESSLTGIQFIVTGVDTDGVRCGDNIKLIGKFKEHVIGDTVYVAL